MNYRDIFKRFDSLNILIIGDVMIDSYWWSKVERISPEAPVPVCAVFRKENRLGGAANVALNIAAMGANPILCTVIGNDVDGEILSGLMKEKNMSTEGLMCSSKRPTTVKTRIIGNKAQMLRVDDETDRPLDKEEEEMFISGIRNIVKTRRIDAIVFQDYDKGVITENVIKQIVTLAESKNIPTAVDPKKRNFSSYRRVSLFKPNLKELKEGLKIDFDGVNKDILSEAALLLHHKQRIDKVFITLSENGVFIADYTVSPAYIGILPAQLRKIADVSGAGDTVISVATLCLALGMASEQMARVSNMAGGLVCESVGVVPVNKLKLLSELSTRN